CAVAFQQVLAEDELRWAMAARSQAKLDRLKANLGPTADAVPTVVADSFDVDSLNAMAARTTVVLTTVGPYAQYGSQLVASCVDAGTHYCDLAGEAQWIRKMIDQHHDRARETGARIVTCCGFDSVPMDIGVWFLQQHALATHERPCVAISMLVKAAKGGASGGTAASIVNLVKEAREDKSVARTLVDPYGLNPEGEREGPDGRDQQDVRFDQDAQCWTAPFVMAGINTKVVRRSNALLDYPWGRDFRYREAVMAGEGLSGRLKGFGIAGSLGALVAGASFGPGRAFLNRFVLPEPGAGPSPEQQKAGFFNLRQFGRLADGTLIRTKITGDRDPGYGSTSKMISECAVCLAQDSLESPGGVLTPASAMGAPLLERLRANAGLTFDVVE
ncbi:MAG: saccharopine dehydrogenase NADP-binding domain-containing protein, partial [Myxococcota bacterium]